MTRRKLCRLSSSEVIKAYSSLLDVSYYFDEIEYIELTEDCSGLLQWLPSVCGDESFYKKLSIKVDNYYPSFKAEYLLAAKYIEDGSSVLEIGCGDGAFGEKLTNSYWFGVDINSAAILKAKQKGLDCEVANIFEDKLNFNIQFSPDYVCSFQMIEHLKDPSALFKAAKRFMTQHSTLIIGYPAHDSLLGKLANSMTPLNLPPHHQTWWTDRAIRDYAESFGFVLIRLEHCSLDQFHAKWFLNTLLTELVVNRLKWARRFPICKQIGTKIASILSALLYSSEVMNDERYGFRGQSCIAVYKLRQSI